MHFKEAKQFVDDQEAEINAITSPMRPALGTTTPTTLALQKEASDRINALNNSAEAAYYKEDDSITTMGSLVGTDISRSIQDSASYTSPRGSPTRPSPPKENILDNQSVTSSITMESFTNLQNQVQAQDSKLTQMSTLLGRMAEVVLKGEKIGQSSLPSGTITAREPSGIPGERP